MKKTKQEIENRIHILASRGEMQNAHSIAKQKRELKKFN